MIKIKRYGWKPSLPHQKKFVYSPPMGATIPNSVDMESKCPAVYDQLQLGSCTGNAAAGLAQFLMMKAGYTSYLPSRLAIYYWNRMLEHTTSWDSGASLYDAMRTLVYYGVPHENLWPYTDQGTQYTVRPSKPVWSDGYWHSIAQGTAVNQSLYDMKSCLSQGFPFIFGFSVYESFESQTVAKTGIVPMPQAGEQVVGGHAVMAVGYNDSTQMIKVRNSWSAKWGQKGYFQLPYAYISDHNLADDFWTAREYVRFKK